MDCSRSTVLWSGYSNGAMVSACRCEELMILGKTESEAFQSSLSDSPKIEEGFTDGAKRFGGHEN